MFPGHRKVSVFHRKAPLHVASTRPTFEGDRWCARRSARVYLILLLDCDSGLYRSRKSWFFYELFLVDNTETFRERPWELAAINARKNFTAGLFFPFQLDTETKLGISREMLKDFWSRKWEGLSWRNSRDEIRFYRKQLDNWCSRAIENAWRCAPECERN